MLYFYEGKIRSFDKKDLTENEKRCARKARALSHMGDEASHIIAGLLEEVRPEVRKGIIAQVRAC